MKLDGWEDENETENAFTFRVPFGDIILSSSRARNSSCIKSDPRR
jgi:hypothetical protein